MSSPGEAPSTTGDKRLRGVAALAGRARDQIVALAGRATSEPIASWALLGAALVAFFYAAGLIGIRIWYEALGPYNVDTPLYWTIGHGILKGYVPYRDLYETKPPGIFLVSALSYLLTGGGALTHLTQILSLAFIALAPLAFVRRLLARGPGAALPSAPAYVSLWAVVLLLAAYVEDRGAEVQVEPHGLAGMILYTLLIGLPGRRAFWGRVIGIGLAIGMKEPFVLLVPSAYLVSDPETRRPLPDFWGPLATAGVVGASILLLLGWLPAYLGIYLKSMAGAHVLLMGSPWVRGLNAVNLTWDNLRAFSLLLPSALFYYAGVYLFAEDPAGATDPAAPEGTPRSLVVRRFQALVIGVLLAGLAVGMGGHFYSHHFIAAVPLYLAVIFALMARLARGIDLRTWIRPVLVAISIAAVMINWVPPQSFIDRIRTFRHSDAAAHESAQVIDAVLDRLGVDRYLYLGPGGWVPYPFTRHIPLGPLFFQQVAFFEGRYPWFVSEFRKRLAEAKVVVFAEYMTGPLTAEIKAEVDRNFTIAPASLIPSGKHCQYPILLRKGMPIP